MNVQNEREKREREREICKMTKQALARTNEQQDNQSHTPNGGRTTKSERKIQLLTRMNKKPANPTMNKDDEGKQGTSNPTMSQKQNTMSRKQNTMNKNNESANKIC